VGLVQDLRPSQHFVLKNSGLLRCDAVSQSVSLTFRRKVVSSSRVERSKEKSKRLLLNTDSDVTACRCIPWYARWLLMMTCFQQAIDWWGYEPETGMNKPRVLLKLSPSIPVTWQTAVLANTLQPARAARSHGDTATARNERTTHAICVCNP
jgi:hypothetical protein